MQGYTSYEEDRHHRSTVYGHVCSWLSSKKNSHHSSVVRILHPAVLPVCSPEYPNFLIADVKAIATYELYNINRLKLENVVHRVVDSAQMDIEIQDRFGNPGPTTRVVPRSFLCGRSSAPGEGDTLKHTRAKCDLFHQFCA
jgi:hypothetical protein